jgi:hypothetical protein
MFSQQAWVASALVRTESARTAHGEPQAAHLGQVAADEPGREYYTVGLASDAPLPELDGVTLLADPGGPYTLAERILDDETTLKRVRSERNDLRVRLATAARELEAAHSALAVSEEARRRTEHWLGVIQRSLSWQLTSPLRVARRRVAELRRR